MVDNNYLDARNPQNPGVAYLDKNQSPQVTLCTLLSRSSRTVYVIVIIQPVSNVIELWKNGMQLLLSHLHKVAPPPLNDSTRIRGG